MTNALQSKGITWADIVLDQKLYQDLVNNAQMGFDMRVENTLFPIPRRDKNAGKFRFTFQLGSNGYLWRAMKYSYGKVQDATPRLLYKGDTFIPHFRDMHHPYDTFEYTPKDILAEKKDEDIVGGFVYIIYDNPMQNKLVIMNRAEINKHRALAQSDNVWSQWYGGMAKKTLIIKAAKAIPLDPSKIDDVYQQSRIIESEGSDLDNQNKILEKQATGEIIEPQELPPASPSLQVPIPAAVPQQEHKSSVVMPEKAF
ncbi:recombinase RecT [Acidaminococcus sp. HCP3S3_G9_1]|uniref:recombinase RecT n=1 Tax=Acidaminococcus sp. HCP3S3_G9_1 TaxID=3438732 RepID=UPI003F92A461